MLCPTCRTQPLRATKFDDGLLGYGCSQCQGALVSLMHYRDWAERTPEPENDVAAAEREDEASDTRNAMCCPKCGKLMAKYRISGATEHSLDLCSSCDEAWLDGGEWRLLKALRLGRDLPKIFTEQWQRRVRQEISETARRDKLRQQVGDENQQKADEVRRWLKDHPHRAELLFYINHE